MAINTKNLIVKRFGEELLALQQGVLKMSSILQLQMHRIEEALDAADTAAARSVMNQDREVNAWDSLLEEHVAYLLSHRQPQSSDLRLMIGVLRMAIDLERVGDEQRNVARQILKERPASELVEELKRVVEPTRIMLSAAEGVVASFDVVQARDLMNGRLKVRHAAEHAERSIINELEVHGGAASGVSAWSIVHSLRRMAAHLENIGEAVVYVVEGEDLRRARP